MWSIVGLARLENDGVIQLGRGRVISKKDLQAFEGPYPVYSAAKTGEGKFGTYGRYDFDEELITWSVDGGGRLFHRERHKFSITNVTGFLRILDPQVLTYRFLYYALTHLHSNIRFDWVKKAHPSVLRKEYTSIPLPPLAEQKRIVERLDKAFAEIDKAQNANAKSERQLMVVLENAVAKLLITPKSTSELTELSEFLDETITGPFGSSLHKSDYTDNGVAVINPQNILNGEISTSNCNFISYEKAKDLSRYSLQVGDIVLGRRGEMGRCAVVDASEKKMICGTGCMILRAKSGCSPYYLAELIRSKYIRSVLEKNSIGMTMANLNQKILLNVKIPRDSYRNQIERVNTCRRLREFVDSAITIRKNKANKLTDIRRSILKQELTPSEAV